MLLNKGLERFMMSVIEKLRNETELDNFLVTRFFAVSKNEQLARNIIATFLLEANPVVEVLADVKTAVSEAVTNSVVHGYLTSRGECKMTAKLKGDELYIKLEDFGVGIEDIEKAREPFFTTGKSGERSGMGFTVMEAFMDEVEVKNQESGTGLVVELAKVLTKSEK